MPRILHCDGCQRSSIIRDEMIGRKIQCNCGRVQALSDTAPYTLAPAGWLDSWGMLGSSIALLLVSLLVGGSVAAWVVLDRENTESEPVAVVPERTMPTTAKEKEPPEEKNEEKERPQAEPKAPEGAKPSEPPVLRTSEPIPARAYSEKELYKRLLPSVVLIYHYDQKYRYTGSGSVIHRGRRLIITNQHVVQRTVENARGKPVGHQTVARVEVLFPQRGEGGELITDKKYYEALMEKHEGKKARVLPGTSEDPDLAVIQLEDELPQDTVALKLAPQPAGAGEKVVLVGNSGLSSGSFGIAPGMVKTRVPNVVIEDYVWKKTWCLENHIPSFHGDSGSPVVNYRGQMVGVHFGGHPKSQVLKYAADH